MATRSVCIIGAGAAGICALRHFSSRSDAFGPVVCYEQTDRVGGTWNYTEETGCDHNGLPIHSSMYRDLKTNLPLNIMSFPDFPSDATESYVHHSQVLQYLNEYADHFDLRWYIHFEHYLTRVTRDQYGWQVTVRDLLLATTITRKFDILILCPGRYSIPKTPSIETLSHFAGSVTHSHHYRSREKYTDQRVAVIGAGPSGIDICLEVATVASEVILLNRKEPFKGLPDNVRQISGEISRFTANSISSIQANGELVEFTIEALIFATGYRFNLHYLDEQSCALRLHEDQTVGGLYRHMICIEHPSMALLSVLMRILPFPLFHQQILYFMRHLLGEIQLPSKQQMHAEAECEFAQRKALGFRSQDRHLATVDSQEEYHRMLVRDGQLEPLPPVTLKMYRYLGSVRAANISRYKEKKYRILNKEDFEEVC